MGLMIDATTNLTGNGWQGFTPFGVEVLHVHGVKLSPLAVQPISGVAPEGWFVWGIFLGGSHT